jgi:DNA-binding protein H-NS
MARPSEFTVKQRADYAREALALIKAGKNGYAKIASKTGKSESTVRVWVKFLSAKEQKEAKLAPKVAPAKAKKPNKRQTVSTFGEF